MYVLLLNLRPKLVVVLGPSHFKSLHNECALPRFFEIQTPFGMMKVDHQVVNNISLNDSTIFTILTSDEDLKEHSIEMQYPFLYKIFDSNDVKLLPILIGHFTDELKRKKAAEVLISAINSFDIKNEVLFVISSDFCHYGNQFQFKPVFNNCEISLSENIYIMDKEGLDSLNSENPTKNFSNYLISTGNTICGREPILLFLEIINRLNIKGKWSLIDYAQSNSLSSINDYSVSYLAAVFCQ